MESLTVPLASKDGGGGRLARRSRRATTLFRTAPTCRNWSKDSCLVTINVCDPTTKVSRRRVSYCIACLRAKILAIRKSAGSYRTLMLFSNRVDCLCDRWFNNFNAAIKLITQFLRIKTVNRAIEVWNFRAFTSLTFWQDIIMLVCYNFNKEKYFIMETSDIQKLRAPWSSLIVKHVVLYVNFIRSLIVVAS